MAFLSDDDELPMDARDLVRDAAPYPSPCLLLDLAVVKRRFIALRQALPEARVLYAVKANPQPEVLAVLAELGCEFDIASPGELHLCRAVAGRDRFLSYGNPIKKERDIAEASADGVGLFSVDSPLELEKVARAAPGASITVRLSVSGAGAEWPLTHKFGCSSDQALDLVKQARHLGLTPRGLSFHVGSQQTRPQAYADAIARAAHVFRAARAAGIRLDLLNIGGGFPAHYTHEVPPLDAYARSIRQAIHDEFPTTPPELVVEPGRYLVGDAGVMVTEVVLVAERPHERTPRFVYLDAGVWSGLDETMGERIRYAFYVSGPARDHGPAVMAGPTCDSADILYRHDLTAPSDLRPGDRVLILSAGAYTATCSTVGFNGFPPLPTFVLDSSKDVGTARPTDVDALPEG